MPVGALLQSITSQELTEWMAYDLIDPIGEARADVRAGMVAATIANTNRDPKSRPEPFVPADFIPRWDERLVAQERDAAEQAAQAKGAELVASILTFQATHGGEVRKRSPEEAEAARQEHQREFAAVLA